MSKEYWNNDMALAFFIDELKQYDLKNRPHAKADFKVFKESLLDQYVEALNGAYYKATKEKGDWLFRKAIEIINLKIGN
jgi:hypothetical protein